MRNVLLVSILLNVLFTGVYINNKIKFNRNSKQESSYYNIRTEQYKYLPVGINDVVFIGDSQVQNFPLSELFKNSFLVNRGVLGDDTKGILNRIEEVYNAKKVFIEVGVNDLKIGKTVNEVARNIDQIVTNIRTNNPKAKFIFKASSRSTDKKI